MSTVTPPLCNPVVLPTELWLALVDAILADTGNPGRFLGLARLAWTCRSAYLAARRPLWQHLRLVFRINSERILAPDVDSDNAVDPAAKHCQQIAFRNHTNVLNCSVFPGYRVGQLSLESVRLNRIRQVSQTYVHLQPFVVLDGQLYLASLVENERNPIQPNFAGIDSLWATDIGSSLATGARVVGGLVLVPYPLHWVNELTIDTLGSGDDIGDCPRTLKALHSDLSFIFRMDPNQVRSLHFYTDSGQGTWSIYNPIAEHFCQVLDHDYFLAGGEHYCPAFGPSTRNVQIFHTGSFDSDRDVFVTLSNLPIVGFEQHGSGCFDMRFDASLLMVSPTLTRLVLDYDLDASGAHEPFEMHLPALEQLTLTFQIAEMLFSSDYSEIMFPTLDVPPPLALNKSVIFPALTHLTLLDVEPDGTNDRPENDPVYVPWIPYHHMPHLSHFSIPSDHRGARNRHIMHPDELQSLFTHTRLDSLVALKLEGLADPESDPEVTSSPVSAPYLQRLETTLGAAYQLPGFVDSTPELTFVMLDIDDICMDLSFFENAPRLTHLHLLGQEFHSDWWLMLARALPQLTHLTIHDTEDVDQVGAEFVIDVDSTTNASLSFPNLEYLAFTMTHGTMDFTGLEVPRLKHLVVNTEHPRTFPSVYRHLESLHLTGTLCPVQVFRVLNDLPADCRINLAPPPTRRDVQVCGVHQLRMRFAGAANRHGWRALLGGAPFAKQAGLVKESVMVAMDLSSANTHAVQDGDPELIAQVLAHLFGEQEPASMACFVTCDASQGQPLVVEEVDFGKEIVQAILEKGIAAFSVVQFR